MRCCTDSDPCLDRDFGFFGLCDPAVTYGHGAAFLDAMADAAGPAADSPLRLPDLARCGPAAGPGPPAAAAAA